MGWEKVAC